MLYDNNGNLKQNSKYKFSYDYKNRLVKVTNISGTGIIAEFKYDVLGRRYEKKVNNETVNYIYSDKNVISEYKTTNGNTFKKEYINGLGIDNVLAFDSEENGLSTVEKEELSFCNNNVLTNTGGFVQYGWQNIVSRCESLSNSGSLVGTNRYYLHKNHLGSITAITNASGSVVTEYDYDVFGKASIVSGSDIGNTIIYTGREYDKEIGLYYFRARYYDAELGRFINRDPIGQVDDVNLYGYVGNNSVMYTDLLGLGKDSIPNIYDNLFILDDIALNILYVIKVGIENDPIVKLHYIEQRNKNLNKYDNFEQLDLNIYKIQDQKYNKFHRYNYGNYSDGNVKYLSNDGKQEAIYNTITQTFDYSDINGATYNFGTNKITHTLLDVIPYYIFGNSPNDPTNIFDRVFQTFK